MPFLYNFEYFRTFILLHCSVGTVRSLISRVQMAVAKDKEGKPMNRNVLKGPRTGVDLVEQTALLAMPNLYMVCSGGGKHI